MGTNSPELLGGFAVMVLWLVGACLAAGQIKNPVDWQGLGDALANALPGAIAAGLIVFGFATVVRSFRDEVSMLVGWWAEKHDKATKQALLSQIDTLTKELRSAQTSGMIGTEFEAEQDAILLLDWAYGDTPAYDRESARQHQMGKTRWDAATELLKSAGVMNGRKKIEETVAGYDAARAILMTYLRTSKHWVKTADGGWAKQ